MTGSPRPDSTMGAPGTDAQCGFVSRRYSRRQVLVALGVSGVGAVLAACGGDDDLSPGVTVVPEADGGPEAQADPPSLAQVGPDADAPASLAVAPLIWVEPREVLQGASFIVSVEAPGAGFASVAFNGQVLTMLREGSRFFTILGLDALTPLGPLPVIISVADAAGVPVVRRETIIDVRDSQWQTEVVELDDENRALLDSAIIKEDLDARDPVVRRETPERLWDDIFDPPAKGVITSGYGLLRSYNFREPTEYHSGLDFAGALGDPIVAPNTGIVAWAGHTRRRGNSLIVDHGGGVYSGFYHLSDSVVAPGEVVRMGDFIGRIGATGLSTGPHLHWEVTVHGITVNPVQWIRANDFPDPFEEFDPLTALPEVIQFAN